MKLLVTQLQNQNPLEPMDNNQMASQLAQLSELQQMESMNTTFSSVLDMAQRSYASSLVGKQVAFNYTPSEGADPETLSGTVQEIQGTGSDISLIVSGYKIGLNDLLAVGTAAQ